MARAADTETSAVVKILEDGSISSVLSFPPQVTLSPVRDMIKSETPNGTFLYVIFNSSTYYNYKTTDGTWVNGYIGQILCVHEDGTFHDILGTEGNAQPVQLPYPWSKIHNSLQFDGTGNMYYMGSNGDSSGSVLYRYNPFTGTKTALTAAISGVFVTAFQISKDGNWIFSAGNSNSNQFLRATPLADTENPQDIVYGNDKNIGYDSWVYDDTTDSVYVASDGNLYKYTKDTTTEKFSTESYETLVESRTEIEKKRNEFWKKCNAFRNDVDGNLFDLHSEVVSTSTADWKGFLSYWDSNESKTQNIIILNDDGSLNAENLLKGLLVKSWYSLSESRRYETVTDENGREHQKAVYLTTDDVDLRFDLFANIEGFEALAEATAGKKNAEALAALDSKEKRGLLYALLGNVSQGRYAHDDIWRCYYHNFFADVLYVKDTDILLVDSDNSAFSKSTVKTTAFEYGGLDRLDILANIQIQSNRMDVYTLGSMYQKENGTADTQKILEFFFSYCNEEGTKEFRLTAFKDDEEYSDLYAEGLVDDEAIAYITAKERIDLFRRCIRSSRSAVTEDYKDYQSFIFLHDTCFLKETGTSACTLKLIDYDTSSLFSFSGLVWNNSELWGRGSNWNPETQKNSLQLMKILDSNHEFSGAIISLDASLNWNDMFYNNIQITDGYVYYRNNISGSTYDIRRISLADGNAEENLFTNVNGNWEVLSFTVCGDYLYYSSYRGTAINNGRITLSTKENTPLSDTFKLTALTAY